MSRKSTVIGGRSVSIGLTGRAALRALPIPCGPSTAAVDDDVSAVTAASAASTAADLSVEAVALRAKRVNTLDTR